MPSPAVGFASDENLRMGRNTSAKDVLTAFLTVPFRCILRGTLITDGSVPQPNRLTYRYVSSACDVCDGFDNGLRRDAIGTPISLASV